MIQLRERDLHLVAQLSDVPAMGFRFFHPAHESLRRFGAERFLELASQLLWDTHQDGVVVPSIVMVWPPVAIIN